MKTSVVSGSARFSATGFASSSGAPHCGHTVTESTYSPARPRRTRSGHAGFGQGRIAGPPSTHRAGALPTDSIDERFDLGARAQVVDALRRRAFGDQLSIFRRETDRKSPR